MAKKDVYDGDLDASMDFAAAGPNGEPASGLAVQNYIKKKIGVGYTVENGTEHLFFADEASMEAYIADPTREDLIIDRFPLEALYHMSYDLLSDIYNYLFVGGTGNVIRYTFETTNKSGGVVAEPVTVTYTIVRGGTKQVVTMKYGAGTEVAFNVDKYLLEGTNSITVAIRGQLSNVGVSFSVVYQVISLSLVDSMDISRVYRPNSGDTSISVPYTVTGAGQKVMEWYVDGERVQFNRAEDEINDNTSSRTKFIDIAGLEQGMHTLQFRVGIVVNGETFYSEVHYREFIISQSQAGNPIITTAVDLPVGASILGALDPVVISPTQYEAFLLRIGVFNPNGDYQNTVVAAVNGTNVASVVCSEGAESRVSITLATTGAGVLTLSVGSYTREISLDVQATTLDIHEITADLQMNFTAEGKSNESSDKSTWTDGTNHATLTGFDWTNVSGWVANRLVIPSGAHIDFDLAPLATNPAINGKTIELEFRTINVDDDNATLIDLINATTGAGIKVTATEVFVKSQGGLNLSRRYKNDEDLRVSIVINKRQNSTYAKLVQVYFNGVLSITQNFAPSDQFTAPNLLSVGGTDAGIILRQIRIYDSALDADAIVNNFTLYRPTVDEMLAVYERNDLYGQNVSQFDLDKIAGFLPVMIITGDLTPIETATDNKATTVVDIDYTNLQNPDYSFRMYHAQMRPQGTSSLTYPRKNLRLYTQKRDDTIVYDSTGKVIESRLYAFKDGAQPVNCWTLKADFAESSSTHNTGVARLWNNVLKQAQVNGEYVLRTEAQQTALDNGFQYDVRTTVDGFPIVIFHRRTEDDPLTFLGKYNFNNDKSTESVFGFKGIPGFDNTNVQCWEFRDSGFDLALFKTPTSGRTYAEEFDYYASDYKKLFKQVWESRYPDTDSPSYTHLRRLAVWINSTEGAATLSGGKIVPGDPAKFAKWQAEKTQYFDLPKLAAYYIYLIRFGAVDQTVKNAMMTTEDGDHWYFINYDNDTILGVRNDGLLKFGPEIDRQSPDPELGGYAYAGHDSVLWNNFEADPECMAMVRTIDSALFTAGLTYANMIQMFNVLQAGKWAEKVYNKDAMYKYLEPYLYQDKNYLGSLQGSRADHRKWWISNRFALYDAIYANDSYNNNAITMLIPNAKIGESFSIVSGRDFYYGWGQNRIPTETGVFVEQGQTHQFVLSMNFEIGTPLRIYAPQYIETLDISGLMQFIGSTNFNLAPAYSETLGSKMKTLIMGVQNPLTDLRRNTALDSPSGLATILTLENLNVAGFEALTTLNLSTLYNLKTFQAHASGLTSVTFANGAPLTSIQLPKTLQVLSLDSLPYLQTNGIVLEVDYDNNQAQGRNIYKINIHNCPGIANSPNLVLSWLTNKITEDNLCELSIDGVDWTISRENMTRIANFKNNGGALTLRGKVDIGTIGSQEYANFLMDTFGENVFNPDAEFYIKADPEVFVSTNDAPYNETTGKYEILEGESPRFRAVVIGGDLGGTATFQILSGSREGVSIDSSTGVLTTIENGVATANLTLRAVYVSSSGLLVGTVDIQVIKRVYPTDAQTQLVGNSQLVMGTPNTYQLQYSTPGVNGNMYAEWSLTGDIASYASIASSTNSNCVVALGTQPADPALSGLLTVVLKKVVDDSVILTKTKSVGYQDDTIAISRAINPWAMDVMVENNLINPDLGDTNDKMTKVSAALVTANQLQPGTTQSTSIFSGSSSSATAFKNNCTNFDEFKWFVSVTELRPYLFADCSLRTFIAPTSVVGLGNYCFTNCVRLTEVVIPGALTSWGSNVFSYCNALVSAEFGAYNIDSNPGVSSSYLENFKELRFRVAAGEISVVRRIGDITNAFFKYTSGTNGYSLKFLGEGTFNITSRPNIGDNRSPFNKLEELYFDPNLSAVILGNIMDTSGYANGAFQGFARLTGDVDFHGTPVNIGRNAFYNTPIAHCYGSNINQIGILAFGRTGLLELPDLTHVTELPNAAFEYSELQSVVLPNNITTLGSSVFAGCTNLRSVVVGSGVTSIYDVSTFNSNSIESFAVDPQNSVYRSSNGNCLIRISDSTLLKGFKTTIIPGDVVAIANEAFKGQPIVNLEIPNSVTSIGTLAFHQCTALTSVSIGSGVTSLGTSCFIGCTALTTVTIPSNVEHLPSYAFKDCTNLATVSLSEGVLEIGNQCFWNCTSIQTIDIPSSLVRIGMQAFYGCTGLTTITIPSSVTTIGSQAFSSCTGLTSAIVNATVTELTATFVDCTSLTSVTLPQGLLALKYNSGSSVGVFGRCTSLTSVTLPSSLTRIEDYAFSESGLTQLHIPAAVNYIGYMIVSKCSNLTVITVDASNSTYADYGGNCIVSKSYSTLVTGCKATVIPNNVTRIGQAAFSYCTGLTSITLPSSVTGMDAWAFANCTDLTTVVIQGEMTHIGQYALEYCSSLISVTFPATLQVIQTEAFMGCSALPSISIPSNVWSIGARAFAYCSNLTVITCNPETPPTLMSGSLPATSVVQHIYVPSASVDAYKGASNWSTYSAVIEAIS